MRVNRSVADPTDSTPWVRVIVPLGRSISMGLEPSEVMVAARLRASRSVGQTEPTQGLGPSSAVVVTVRTCTAAWAGTRRSTSARPRNRSVRPPSAMYPTRPRSLRMIPICPPVPGPALGVESDAPAKAAGASEEACELRGETRLSAREAGRTRGARRLG